MKILYVGLDEDAAAAAQRALHGTAQNVTLKWVQSPGSALDWLQENRDAAAVVVEVHAQSCAPFVEQLRVLGLTTPVVVVAGSVQPEVAIATLNAGADGYLPAGPTIETDLPRIVVIAIARARARREYLTRAVTELEGERDRAKDQLARTEALRQQAEARTASELAAATAKLAELQARQDVSRAREARICTALQERLFELERAVRNADERSAAEVASFAEQLARRHAEFTASLTRSTESHDALAAQLNAANAALDEAQHARRAEAAAAAEHLGQREAEMGAALAEAIAARTALEARLAAAEAAHLDARQRATIDLAAANERQAALEDLLARDADTRRTLERKLAVAEAAHREADERHASELTRAAAQLDDVQSRYDAALQENAAARAALESSLAESHSALQHAMRQAAADLAAASDRETALDGRLAHEVERSWTLQQQLVASANARREAERSHAAALATAAARFDALQSRYDAAVAQHGDDRSMLEQQLAGMVAARQEADRSTAGALAAAALREAELVERLTSEAAVRAAREHELADARMDGVEDRRRLLAVVSTYRRRGREQTARFDALLHELAAAQEQLKHLHVTLDDEQRAHERTRLTGESEIQRASGEYAQLRQSFEGLQASFRTLEQIAGEHAAEHARLERVVAERDRELNAQADRHRLAEQTAEDAFAQLQERFRQASQTSSAEIVRLQRELDAVRRDLTANRTRAEALHAVAVRVPELEEKLDRTQKERRREFERAPYGLCRCTENGVITDANHSFMNMIGRRRVDDVRNLEFAEAVFDCAGDLGWLVERTRTTRKTETVETKWKTREGRHLVVRLHALAVTTGAVEIVVEDVTDFRALEERLRQAQRMEAVGRLASEVAVTCDALLRDVIRDAHECVGAIGRDDTVRRHADRLVTDATRAASFLRQLGVYGSNQARALEPVSAQRVLRDLAPVLRRVVGDQIQLVLSKSTGSFDVDVEAERLERVLVNVAGYARQRMPDGGQMKIDLATTAVGRRFVARYPNVRPGDHVLITVTELPGESQFRGERAAESPEKAGVDLGALVELVGTCGGHLWMEAQPAGNMVVKIHLPKRAAAGDKDQPAADARGDRGGRLSRWFRSGSGAGNSGA
jgi:hypothetical protein